MLRILRLDLRTCVMLIAGAGASLWTQGEHYVWAQPSVKVDPSNGISRDNSLEPLSSQAKTNTLDSQSAAGTPSPSSGLGRPRANSLSGISELNSAQAEPTYRNNPSQSGTPVPAPYAYPLNTTGIPYNGPNQVRTTRRARVVWYYETEPIPTEELARTARMKELTTKLRTADEAEQDRLLENVKTELETIFDEDIARRENEILEVESRIAELRNKLEERKAARNEIIDNRIDSLTLDARGLGFPGAGPTSNASGYYSVPNENLMVSPVDGLPAGYSAPGSNFPASGASYPTPAAASPYQPGTYYNPNNNPNQARSSSGVFGAE